MKVIEQICNRVAIIENSHIVEAGRVDEVFRNPKTAAAKKLLYPRGGYSEKFSDRGKVLRLIFDGNSADRPVIANMVLKCGAPVNIVFADTKNIDGKMYGQMLLQIPENPDIAKQITAYLENEKISFGEEDYHV
jgi:D-methionine transport system ATP-binding protein